MVALGRLTPTDLNTLSATRAVNFKEKVVRKTTEDTEGTDEDDVVYPPSMLNAEDVARLDDTYTILSTVGSGSYGTAYLASTYSDAATDRIWKRICSLSDQMVFLFDDHLPMDEEHPMRPAKQERTELRLKLGKVLLRKVSKLVVVKVLNDEKNFLREASFYRQHLGRLQCSSLLQMRCDLIHIPQLTPHTIVTTVQSGKPAGLRTHVLPSWKACAHREFWVKTQSVSRSQCAER